MTKRKNPEDLLKTGRPTKYTKELAIEICSHIGMGNSLRKTCEMEGMPTFQSVYIWFKIYPAFLEQYAHAKDDSADSDADKLDEIAEGVLDGTYEPANARVAADIIKWSAGKKRPKKYGDKQQLEISGKRELSDFTDDELMERLRDLDND